ncbi:uncharacterized protein Rv2082-like [Pogoniulus pusillus]|uniref:uncharacterized protein Rv2082-like n=1 Tax=Pogoniulus pusillus TaxID=488313 RepID=UPI0030B976F9
MAQFGKSSPDIRDARSPDITDTLYARLASAFESANLRKALTAREDESIEEINIRSANVIASLYEAFGDTEGVDKESFFDLGVGVFRSQVDIESCRRVAEAWRLEAQAHEREIEACKREAEMYKQEVRKLSDENARKELRLEQARQENKSLQSERDALLKDVVRRNLSMEEKLDKLLSRKSQSGSSSRTQSAVSSRAGTPQPRSHVGSRTETPQPSTHRRESTGHLGLPTTFTPICPEKSQQPVVRRKEPVTTPSQTQGLQPLHSPPRVSRVSTPLREPDFFKLCPVKHHPQPVNPQPVAEPSLLPLKPCGSTPRPPFNSPMPVQLDAALPQPQPVQVPMIPPAKPLTLLPMPTPQPPAAPLLTVAEPIAQTQPILPPNAMLSPQPTAVEPKAVPQQLTQVLATQPIPLTPSQPTLLQQPIVPTTPFPTVQQPAQELQTIPQVPALQPPPPAVTQPIIQPQSSAVPQAAATVPLVPAQPSSQSQPVPAFQQVPIPSQIQPSAAPPQPPSSQPSRPEQPALSTPVQRHTALQPAVASIDSDTEVEEVHHKMKSYSVNPLFASETSQGPKGGKTTTTKTKPYTETQMDDLRETYSRMPKESIIAYVCRVVQRGAERIILSREEVGRTNWGPEVFLGDGPEGDLALSARIFHWASAYEPSDRGDPTEFWIRSPDELNEAFAMVACIQAVNHKGLYAHAMDAPVEPPRLRPLIKESVFQKEKQSGGRNSSASRRKHQTVRHAWTSGDPNESPRSSPRSSPRGSPELNRRSGSGIMWVPSSTGRGVIPLQEQKYAVKPRDVFQKKQAERDPVKSELSTMSKSMSDISKSVSDMKGLLEQVLKGNGNEKQAEDGTFLTEHYGALVLMR